MRNKKLYGLVIALFSFLGCGQPREAINHAKEVDVLSEKDIIEHIKLAINPIFQDWVLFQNGTYIIFDSIDTSADIETEAIALIKKYGPVHAGGEAGDFAVTHLNKTAGWVVSGHGYGMYTYVHPIELSNTAPTDVQIGLLGRSKREMDGQRPLIIYMNRKGL